MKKRIAKKKKYLLNRAEKMLRLRRHSKAKKKAKRIRLIGLSKAQINAMRQNEKEQKNIKRIFSSYKHIEAPKCLSMIENPEGTLTFIKDLEKSLDKKRKSICCSQTCRKNSKWSNSYFIIYYDKIQK